MGEYTNNGQDENTAAGNGESHRAISWGDIHAQTRCYPEYSDDANTLIRRYIGFFTSREASLPHEAFIQALIAGFLSKEISEDNFLTEVEFHCMLIRNAELKKDGKLIKPVYGREDKDEYRDYLNDYKYRARQRLTGMMVEEPPLEHSLYAELLIRQNFEIHDGDTGIEMNDLDVKALSMTHYRQTFLLEGLEAADRSVLYGLACLIEEKETLHDFLKEKF